MYATPELVSLIQRERERQIELATLARLALSLRNCCRTSLFGRLARALRVTPAPR